MTSLLPLIGINCCNIINGINMSKEFLTLALIIIGTTTTTAILLSGTISPIGQILSVPSLTTVWALRAYPKIILLDTIMQQANCTNPR